MPVTVKLDPFFTQLWQGRDPFAEVEKIEGEVFRHVKTRRTFRKSTTASAGRKFSRTGFNSSSRCWARATSLRR